MNATNVTYVSDSRGRESYRLVSMEEVAGDIRSGRFAAGLKKLRELVAGGDYEMAGERQAGSVSLNVRGVPGLCVASAMKNSNGERRLVGYNRLVLLEINNLPDTDTAEALRDAAGSVPFTMLAFVGAEGLSVKVVCRAQAVTRELESELLAEAAEKGWGSDILRLFHANAYRHLRQTYLSQLGVSVDQTEPCLDATCLMSADPGVCFNPDATPVVVDARVYDTADNDMAPGILPATEEEDLLGMPFHELCLMRYMNELGKAYTECGALSGDDWQDAMLNRLARGCRDAGLPEEFCLIQVRNNLDFSVGEDAARTVFDAFYARLHSKTGRRERLISTSDLVGLKTERFLREHYQLRINTMTGVAQYRRRNAHQTGFCDISPRALNSMCQLAVNAGLGIWDKDVRRYIESDRLQAFDPLCDYLDHLPRWDGKDRLTPFAQRVKTDRPHWTDDFKVWMRSMVAHWMGKDSVHGNAIVPVLIGRQGGGKTSFCSIIMPPELRDYYNDNLSFRSETDLNLGLTSFGLINIDEFDALSPTKHPLLKYLLSKSDVKMRPPYGKAYVQRRRVASFVATTNNRRPLTDTSGSRRFVCVLADDIDFKSRVNYPQLYSQIKAEIRQGLPYFFRDDDNRRIQQQNEPFMHIADNATMLRTVFLPPEQCTQARPMTVDTIIDHMQQAFPQLNRTNTLNRQLGRLLSDLGYERVRRAQGNGYRIAPKLPDPRKGRPSG